MQILSYLVGPWVTFNQQPPMRLFHRYCISSNNQCCFACTHTQGTETKPARHSLPFSFPRLKSLLLCTTTTARKTDGALKRERERERKQPSIISFSLLRGWVARDPPRPPLLLHEARGEPPTVATCRFPPAARKDGFGSTHMMMEQREKGCTKDQWGSSAYSRMGWEENQTFSLSLLRVSSPVQVPGNQEEEANRDRVRDRFLFAFQRCAEKPPPPFWAFSLRCTAV